MRSLKTVKQELNYLEYNYQHLRIKTVPYLEEKHKLEEEKEVLVKLDEHEYAKIERKEKKQKKSKIQNKFSQSVNELAKKESREIFGDDVHITY